MRGAAAFGEDAEILAARIEGREIHEPFRQRPAGKPALAELHPETVARQAPFAKTILHRRQIIQEADRAIFDAEGDFKMVVFQIAAGEAVARQGDAAGRIKHSARLYPLRGKAAGAFAEFHGPEIQHSLHLHGAGHGQGHLAEQRRLAGLAIRRAGEAAFGIEPGAARYEGHIGGAQGQSIDIDLPGGAHAGEVNRRGEDRREIQRQRRALQNKGAEAFACERLFQRDVCRALEGASAARGRLQIEPVFTAIIKQREIQIPHGPDLIVKRELASAAFGNERDFLNA